MKKLISVLLISIITAITLCSCGNSNGGQMGEVAVFYYTYSDTYISSVRAETDKKLKELGVKFNDYDANGNQTSQTEQIDVAIAKGASALAVNVVDTGSDDAAKNIISKAKSAGIPLVFFNRSVSQEVVSSYDKCVFVGTDYEMAGTMQGNLIGKYLLENYDNVDLNGDGKISYVMFKGQEGNAEAIARTELSVKNCNAVLKAAGKPDLMFYDSSNSAKYLVDQDGLWSSAAATNYMGTILAKYSESGKNMVELIIANNDEMALGAISALQGAGYNTAGGKTIPVFGVDATDAAKTAINKGEMTATIKQDGEGMAESIAKVMINLRDGKERFDGIPKENTVGTWRINIPYQEYLGE